MTVKSKLTPIATALGITLAAILAASPVQADQNPFGVSEISSGYLVAGESKGDHEGKCGGDKAKKEGKCGEGKCGGDKAKKEGKCGEGKCGGDKAKKEGKCGDDKAKKEGKCGG